MGKRTSRKGEKSHRNIKAKEVAKKWFLNYDENSLASESRGESLLRGEWKTKEPKKRVRNSVT